MWLRKVWKARVAIGAWDWAEPTEVAVVVEVVETGKIRGGRDWKDRRWGWVRHCRSVDLMGYNGIFYFDGFWGVFSYKRVET